MKKSVLWKRAAGFTVRHPVPIAFVSILALYFLSRLLMLGKLPIFFDESIYIGWSKEVLQSAKYLISLTDGKPPLHTWVMVPFVWAVKDPLVAGRAASVLFGAFTTCGLIFLGKDLVDWKTGLWAGFLYVVCPFALWYDRVAIAEGLLLTIFVFTAWLSIRAARSLSFWYIPAIGGLIGLGMLTKGTAQLLFIIVPLAFIVRTREDGKKEPGKAAVRWCVIAVSSLLVGYGIYSLLRFSDKFSLIAARTGITTRTFSDIIANPIGPFFSNLFEIFKVMIIFITPVVLVAAVAGLAWGFTRKWRYVYYMLAWIAVVWIVESLVAKHWMFDAILPRFFLVIIPPILLLAAVFLCNLLEWIKSPEVKLGKTWKSMTSIAAIILLVLFPLYSSGLIIFDPVQALLPDSIRFQYLTGWPSGWGIEEIVAFLEEQSRGNNIVVGSNLAGIGLPTSALELYLSDNDNVEIVPFGFEAGELPAELTGDGNGQEAYCVFNMFEEGGLPPGGWPLKLIRKYSKDGNDSMYMLLYKIE